MTRRIIYCLRWFRSHWESRRHHWRERRYRPWLRQSYRFRWSRRQRLGPGRGKNAHAEETLKAVNASASATVCDVADETAVEQAMSGVIERYGRIDACFPNAGIGSGNKKPFIEQSTEDWFRVIDTNLHGVFYTLRAATRQMVKQGQGGSVIFTASGTAIQGMARGQAYAATKGAMISMMLAMSTEMPRYKITANAIIPGWVETGMTETSSNGKSLKTPSFRVSQCVAGVRQRTLAPLPST